MALKRAALALGALALGCGAAPLDVAERAPDPLLTGLVAHWPLDDSTGATATDHSGHGHDGTLTGGTWIDGHFGGALHFASGDAVSVPSFPDAASSWTVALWARPPSGDFGTDYLTLVSTELVFIGGWQMNVTLSPSGSYYEFAYWIGPGDSDYAYLDCNCVDVDQWTHLAATLDSAAGLLSFYKNGALQMTSSTTRTILSGSPTLFMGRWHDADRLYVGDLDDIAIYDHALGTAELARLATAAVPENGP
ncbi:MAG TPA: LamG domain-containing protein [Polyangia bacterium]|jgi:hypothetical protein